MKSIFQRSRTWHRKQRQSAVLTPTQPGTAVEERERLLQSTREQEIRNRAYEIYLQRGAQPGYEVEDWLQAERELTTCQRNEMPSAASAVFKQGELAC
jgi:hypothetical protein